MNKYLILKRKKALAAALDRKEISMDVRLYRSSCINAISDYSAHPSDVLLQKAVSKLDLYEKAYKRLTAVGLTPDNHVEPEESLTAFLMEPTEDSRRALMEMLQGRMVSA